ncbi:D-alanyl-D-alanine carboxypeptidase/D-alanyl-D-alanine-endopeptidase (penicillin-binding protein 4) [Haloactinospora alba]|uniref:D-alanyl-D-alanine carboxypeptidase/D-alanyl-D-alanine-endopeptidase (Penicillin-binding protein 4) n=1 Tax=Haloactinospora alba TaxID=405555 RepID=A0A543NL71_9ACTN|nr:D-alanyl-D-alanine carboxypeptidase/D-alanyl-D-alanine-endopeptidase [Haloactinospora alba]TQN32571.1 D-alanyl-D-alanine carboxypeptidase/D-alanyl-D-alanine-endopeptidase (penicillin-binding protein 4) [Haloactinospora alba]
MPDHPRPRTIALPVITAAALLTASASPAAAATGTADGVTDLRSDLDAILEDPALEEAVSGVVVRSLREDDTLYQRRSGKPLTPASNTKLLTSAAAMEVLGPDHTFDTTVTAERSPDDGLVRGDIHLVGTGDPSLTREAFADLASDVADSGVTEVSGDLVADDTWFDSRRLAPDWEAADEPYYYAAQISALTVAANDDLDTGVVTATASPGPAEGTPVEVELAPHTRNLTLRNTARTGPPSGDRSLDITRPSGGNTFTASGELPAGGDRFSTLRTVHEPTEHAAHLFAEELEREGVTVDGGVERGTRPAETTELAQRESAPLRELLTPFLKLSNNGHAEILTKTMGREAAGEGSWEAGLPVIESALWRLGVPPSGVKLHDGSGLSRTNRLPAATTVHLLEELREEPWFDTWREALPLAGDNDRMTGGTLTNRMRDTPAAGNVRAKTGTLTGVSALSGYVTGADGEPLVFAVLNNQVPSSAARDAQDAIAVRLATFTRDEPTPGPDTASERAPVPRQPQDGLECTWAGTC